MAMTTTTGGHQYFADLLNAIKKLNATSLVSIPISLEFFRIKSYHNDASTGKVQVELTGSETWAEVGQRFAGKVRTRARFSISRAYPRFYSLTHHFIIMVIIIIYTAYIDTRRQHLVVVEDIIDTGRTMTAFLEKLETMQVASVRVTSLLLKRTALSNGYVPECMLCCVCCCVLCGDGWFQGVFSPGRLG